MRHRHADVRPLHHLHTAGDGVTVDCRNHRLLGIDVAQQRAAGDAGLFHDPFVPFVFRLARARHHGDQLSQVGSGAERAAVAGENGDPNPVVCLHFLPGVCKAYRDFRIDRVARIGPVQSDDGHVALQFIVDQRHDFFPRVEQFEVL